MLVFLAHDAFRGSCSAIIRFFGRWFTHLSVEHDAVLWIGRYVQIYVRKHIITNISPTDNRHNKSRSTFVDDGENTQPQALDYLAMGIFRPVLPF